MSACAVALLKKHASRPVDQRRNTLDTAWVFTTRELSFWSKPLRVYVFMTRELEWEYDEELSKNTATVHTLVSYLQRIGHSIQFTKKKKLLYHCVHVHVT